MRKLIALALGACLFIPTVSHAGKEWRWERVNFRTSALNTYAGYVDSGVFRATVTSTAESLQVDTTVAISTRQWALPDIAPGGVADTASFFTLLINRGKTTSLGSADDSFYVMMQVSMNGVDWHLDSLACAGVGPSKLNWASRVFSPVREDGSSGCFHCNQFVVSGSVSGLQWQTPNRGVLDYKTGTYGWPLVRFLIGHTNTTSGEYEASVGYWYDDPMKSNKWRFEPVLWRTAALNTWLGYVDSATVTGGPTSSKADTTAPIAIDNWAVPSYLNSGAAADTATIWSFLMARNNNSGSPTYSDDSIHVVTQISWDGTNWIRDAGSATVAAYTSPQLITLAGYTHSGVTPLLEYGATGMFGVTCGIPTGGPVGVRVGPTNFTSGVVGSQQYFGVKFMRFIIEGDHAGTYRGYLGRYVPTLDGLP